MADGKLSLQVYQRSADMFLGVLFNLASYAALAHMFAQQAGLEVGELIWTGGDCHIYNDHIEQVKEQLSREPRPYPQLKLHKADSLFDYTFDDFEVVGYDPTPPSKRRFAHVKAIWAQSLDGVIGDGVAMPWHVPEDLKH